MINILNNIEEVFQNPHRILKNDATSTVIAIEMDLQQVVVKRANIRGWYHRLRRFFLPSRARKNWRNAHRLLQIGINTFTPIAYIEERYGPFKGRSYFLSTYIEGIRALDYFQNEAKRHAWPDAMKKLVNLSTNLSNNWVSHRDLNLSNVIFKDDIPWLIDLDGMCQHTFSWFAKYAAKREQARFLRNCLETPGVSSEINTLLAAGFSKIMLKSGL